MTITDGIEKVITLPFTFATTDEMSCQMKNASSSLGFGDWYLKKKEPADHKISKKVVW